MQIVGPFEMSHVALQGTLPADRPLTQWLRIANVACAAKLGTAQALISPFSGKHFTGQCQAGAGEAEVSSEYRERFDAIRDGCSNLAELIRGDLPLSRSASEKQKRHRHRRSK